MSRIASVILLGAFLTCWSHALRAQEQEHAGHAEAAEQSKQPRASTPATGLPPITDADRAAAFPDVEGHAVHDRVLQYLVLFDQFEWRAAGDGGGLDWDARGWVGGDLNRLWFRSEGAVHEGGVEQAQAHILYGRGIARWWDLVGGVRHDLRPGPGQTWAAVGIQGLAPYRFDIEATGYFGSGGRTNARFEAEYELLFTNRLILQPLVELEVYGKSDPRRGIGAGVSTAETGLRLRYELRREIAPYLGVTWQRTLGGTARLAASAGREPGALRLAVGLRAWF